MKKVLMTLTSFYSVAATRGGVHLKGSADKIKSRILDHTCASDEKEVILQVQTDSWPEETSWAVSNPNTGKVILEVTYDPLDEIKYFEYLECVPKEQCLLFDVKDSYGDGIFLYEGGFYTLTVDGEVAATSTDNTDNYGEPDGDFGSSEKILIGCDLCNDNSKASVLFEYFPDYSSAFYYETALTVTNLKSGNVMVDVVFGTSDFFYEKVCIDLSKSCYLFEIEDSFGDGIFSDGGYYQLKVDGDIVSTSRDDINGNFGFGEAVVFGDGCGDDDDE